MMMIRHGVFGFVLMLHTNTTTHASNVSKLWELRVIRPLIAKLGSAIFTFFLGHINTYIYFSMKGRECLTALETQKNWFKLMKDQFLALRILILQVLQNSVNHCSSNE